MAIRTISYSVKSDGISPNTEQQAGLQSEHAVTQLVFKLDSTLYQALLSEKQVGDALVYRFDCCDGMGGAVKTEPSALNSDTVTFTVGENLTRSGGKARVYLVISRYNAEEKTETELLSFPAKLRFENVPETDSDNGNSRESLSTLTEAAKNAAEDKSVISLAGNIAKSYFSQALPTVLGKTARTIDNKRRSNYIDKNSQLSEFSQSAINTAKSKIPGLEATRPEYINAWGQAESNGNVAERFFGNFVSPGYYSDIEYSEMSKELLRLSKEVKSEDVNVLPKAAQKSFEVNGKTKYLTAEEYTKYAKAKGQYSYDYVSEFVNSAEYKKLTDEERANVISNLYKYANAKAKATLFSYDLNNKYKTVSSLEKNGISPVNYYIEKAIATGGIIWQ